MQPKQGSIAVSTTGTSAIVCPFSSSRAVGKFAIVGWRDFTRSGVRPPDDFT